MINILRISQEIRKQRLKNDLSQTELSQILGTTQPTISGYENGTFLPDIPQLIRICEALDCTPNDLLGFTKEGDR